MPSENLAYFSFAEEKLVELEEIKTLAEEEGRSQSPAYQRNKE